MRSPMRMLLALALVGVSTTAFATPVTVTVPANFRDNRSANPIGVVAGDRDLISANVTPNGAGGTTMTATRSGMTITVPSFPFTLLPNNFSITIPWNGDTGAWQLTATNGSDTTTLSTPPIPTAEVIPLVTNLQVIGNGVTPTIQWTVPDLTGLPGNVDRMFVRVWDLSRTVNGVADIIFDSPFFPPLTNSYTIPSGLLQIGRSYSFDIVLDDLVTFPSGAVALENRSETFSSPFAPVPEPTTLVLLGLGATVPAWRAARGGRTHRGG